MSLFVSMYFRFKQTGYKCVGVYQCIFSVITSFGIWRLRLIHLHAIWLCHAFSWWYIKATLLSGLALFSGVHYQVFWLTLTCWCYASYIWKNGKNPWSYMNSFKILKTFSFSLCFTSFIFFFSFVYNLPLLLLLPTLSLPPFLSYSGRIAVWLF